MWSTLRPVLFTSGKAPDLPTEQEVRWALQQVWVIQTGENFLPCKGICRRFLGSPARNLATIRTKRTSFIKTYNVIALVNTFLIRR